jgi:PAS domain S-box-containing protein
LCYDALVNGTDLRHLPAWIYQAVLDNMSDGIAVVDRTGNFLLYNREGERISGIGGTPTRPEEWTQTYGIYLPDQKTPVPTASLPLVRAMGGESVDDFHLFVRNARIPGGVHLSVTGRPIRNQKGELCGAFVVFRELTEWLNARNELESDGKRFRSLVELAPEGIGLLDAQGILSYASPSAERALGRSPGELPGRKFSTLVHPEDLAAAADLLQGLLRRPGESTRHRLRLLRKDGAVFSTDALFSNHFEEPSLRALVVRFRTPADA